ncbi:MAG: zinc ribbon domain-containing protein [Spirochaetota bacterium]|nr:MAG: zinc ribbon domain-containing protein [Spirochaetota bacterium]
MPTYDYKCNKCEEIFERFQKITDPPLQECPVCGGELKRLISGGIGVIFKGSGFYVTDSKKPSGKSTKSPSSPSTAKKEPEKKEKINKDSTALKSEK